ncbi:MAG TPA: hypothetical protein PK367_01880 [Candidatus Paceibacterota bacterium]|nr:hypothetical protein [Candidatus Paceibacterota bacterium]
METKNKNWKYFKTKLILSVFVLLGIFLLGGVEYTNAYQTVSPGQSIIIGEFVYDDDFQATTTPCTINIYDPLGSLIIQQAMTAQANGWHYYVFSGTSTQGTWPTFISCGSLAGGDLAKIDKTFIVGYSEISTSTFSDIPANVWENATRTLTSGTSIASDVWNATTRQLTTFGTLVSNIWSDATAPIRRLTDKVLTGGGSLATEEIINTATSTIINETNNQTNSATTTIITEIKNYIDTATSTVIGTINEVQTVQNTGWRVSMSNVERVLIGKTFRAKIFVVNPTSTPTDSFDIPQVTLYDADRNTVVSAVDMTKLSDGVYEYTYLVPGSAAEGLWEAKVSTEVESGKIIQTNDYWSVEGAPAQVIINGVTGTTIPNILANVTITNEGLIGYEYHYEWCVVSSVDNSCGGGDDTYYASASKFINPGIDWNTNLSATVVAAGNYYFKLVVYYGTEKSGASRSFVAQAAVVPPPGGGGGGGTPVVSPIAIECSGADFNRDKTVNSIDFSILLAFWKTVWPFRNPCVDINSDKQVNSVDFSILMYQWGTKRP